ncbi:MAG TPA: hypothetical protein VFI74_00380 [Candidatus Saccharimonadales bacterium]|nr:hypothetical protein [Candidatus Saccharimonadales bacterium]
MSAVVEYIVVGSGCSGAMAAQTLIEAGKQVTMLDVGVQNPDYDTAVPSQDYLTIRKTDPNQHHYLIGKKAEGLTWGDIGKGAQVTPTRKHLSQLAEDYLPVESDTFSPIESLGYGGLGIGWGLQCWEYSRAEQRAAGLDSSAMPEAYEIVSKRIGVSATRDEASPYTMGDLQTFQPSPTMDRNHRRIYQNYQKKRRRFNAQGLHMGRTPLALLTQDLGQRKKYAYHDMDFYTDNGHSAWRPWMTVNELRKHKNFTYKDGLLVLSFKEEKGGVLVHALQISDHSEVTFKAKKLILAANPLSSGRIVLRSLGDFAQKLPLLCNPYTYIPCLQPGLVGKAAEAKKMGFAQLTLFLDEKNDHKDLSVASLYSYQSLMLFRIIRQLPLNFRDARIIMRYLMSGLEIMGVHHPDMHTKTNYMQRLERPGNPTGDALAVRYEVAPERLAELRRREKVCMAAMRSVGVFPLKRVDPGYGASVHYAGTLPYSQEPKPFHLRPDGKLHGTKHVYVADSAGFTYLPAKGLTFSLLANAHLTAERALRS